ncbi:MAG: hypothetical protein WBM45_10090, partial [Woeseiaceae bacterium]
MFISSSKESLRASREADTMLHMLELSEKPRLGRKAVVLRTRQRKNSSSHRRCWGNHQFGRGSSSGRLFYNYYRTYDPSTGRYLESD